jgi:hypothetical protein
MTFPVDYVHVYMCVPRKHPQTRIKLPRAPFCPWHKTVYSTGEEAEFHRNPHRLRAGNFATGVKWGWVRLRGLMEMRNMQSKLEVRRQIENLGADRIIKIRRRILYTLSNKNQSVWYFVRPAQAVTWRTVTVIIRVVLLSPYLRIRGVSLSYIHYNQSHRVYINRRQQYICVIWN